MKVLLLDTAFAAAPIYNYLVDGGHQVWVMGNRPADLLARKAGANWIEQDYSQIAAVEQHVQRLGIEGVVPGCTDVSIETCLRLSVGSHMRDSPDTNRALSSKDVFRRICERIDLPAPRVYEESAFPTIGAIHLQAGGWLQRPRHYGLRWKRQGGIGKGTANRIRYQPDIESSDRNLRRRAIAQLHGVCERSQADGRLFCQGRFIGEPVRRGYELRSLRHAVGVRGSSARQSGKAMRILGSEGRPVAYAIHFLFRAADDYRSVASLPGRPVFAIDRIQHRLSIRREVRLLLYRRQARCAAERPTAHLTSHRDGGRRGRFRGIEVRRTSTRPWLFSDRGHGRGTAGTRGSRRPSVLRVLK